MVEQGDLRAQELQRGNYGAAVYTGEPRCQRPYGCVESIFWNAHACVAGQLPLIKSR